VKRTGPLAPSPSKLRRRGEEEVQPPDRAAACRRCFRSLWATRRLTRGLLPGAAGGGVGSAGSVDWAACRAFQLASSRGERCGTTRSSVAEFETS
jgi:hypothetical protein